MYIGFSRVPVAVVVAVVMKCGTLLLSVEQRTSWMYYENWMGSRSKIQDSCNVSCSSSTYSKTQYILFFFLVCFCVVWSLYSSEFICTCKI